MFNVKLNKYINKLGIHILIYMLHMKIMSWKTRNSAQNIYHMTN